MLNPTVFEMDRNVIRAIRDRLSQELAKRMKLELSVKLRKVADAVF